MSGNCGKTIQVDNNPHLERLTELIQNINEERTKYVQANICLEALSKFEQKDNPLLKVKLNNILYGLTPNLANEKKSLISVVGLKDVNCKINLEESSILKMYIKETLKNTSLHNSLACAKLKGKYTENVEHSENATLTLPKEYRLIKDMKKDIEQEQAYYTDQLQKKMTLLEEICLIRTEKVPEIANRRIQEFDTQFQKIDCRMQLLNCNVIQSIFHETSCTMKAFLLLSEDIKKLRILYENKIEDTKMILEKYKLVDDSQEYNEILKKYVEYKKYFEGKQFILKSIQGGNE